MEHKKLRIAFVTYYKKESLKKYHSALYHILQTIQNLGHDVIVIDNLDSLYQKIFKIKSFYYYKIKKSSYNRLMDKPVTKSIGRIAKQKLEKYDNIDLIIAPGTVDIAFLETDIPIIVWTDTPFVGLLNENYFYLSLSDQMIQDSIKFDLRAHENSKYIIYPSAWAENKALKSYNISSEKIKIIRFGSTLDNLIKKEELNEIINNKLSKSLLLFFAANKWLSKGGAKIFDTLKILKIKIPDVKLHIAGVSPEIPLELKDNVILHGFLSKDNTAEYRKFIELFKSSHFFFMPSLAETFGLVYADASSMGLPSIASDVCGVPSVVENGINGYTFPIDTPAEQIADKIVAIYNDKIIYSQLCHSTFEFYQQCLNWAASGVELQKLLNNI